ncbi:SMP-30/gluconolactonase/LRE family protein [Microbulbifer sp. SH-1]|uniref:SMP-30/gluconolactonase/LRE family protein n=1 Tax=Microbulbifer sp. SH-1 TaxID=2681547 RepID=UPI00140C092F|nr:SMP-30/gluconolactonase/LRE family protein [Microbulbifer sp. SH-1]QIL89716.1 SMP-30/gluconolactonase/LRE family protein [Microbulbifer sp. SH-1]
MSEIVSETATGMQGKVELELVNILPVANQLGECPLWHPERQQLYWTDILGCRLYRYTPTTDALEVFDTEERLASFGFIRDSDWLICGFASGIARYQPQSGEVEWLYRLPDQRELRLNDGRVDPQGRFWVGAMIENGDHVARSGFPEAHLYCCDPDGRVTEHLGDIRISNSLSWSSAGDRLYFADSPRHEIYSYEFDAVSGQLGEKILFARTPAGVHPDGSTVDAEGHLWNAHWGASQLVRYGADGAISETFPLPASQPTCCAFGGADFDTLFVTSACCGLDDTQLVREPEAGNLLIYRVHNARGRAEALFAS